MQAGLLENITEDTSYSYVIEESSANLRQKVLDQSLEKSFGIVWIDVETNPSPNCGWSTDFEKNCNFLSELVDKLQAKGLPVGIYLSSYMWNEIMGSQFACPHIAKKVELIWYARYDNVKSFDGFKPMGGWTKPYAKQFAGLAPTPCGINLDQNYLP